jgi:hypothetical protein
VSQQPPLAFETAGVADQASVAADHPVTRDRDRDRVVMVRTADGARRARLSDPARDLPVACRGSRRNLAERPPHPAPERGAVRIERKRGEGRAVAREVFRERGAHPREHAQRSCAVRVCRGDTRQRGCPYGKDVGQPALARDERIAAERCVDRRGREMHLVSSSGTCVSGAPSIARRAASAGGFRTSITALRSAR